MKKITLVAAFIAAASLVLSASTAVAAYVAGPLPAEFTGGSVPPTSAALKAEDKADKALGKLLSGARKCFRVGARNVSRGRPSKVDDCLNGPHGAVTRFDREMGKIDARHDLPPCTLTNLSDAATVVAQMEAYNPLIYCQSPSGAFLDSPLQ